MNRRRLYRWAKEAVKGWTSGSRHQRENVGIMSRGVVSGQSSHLRDIAGGAGGKADSQLKRLKRFLVSSMDWRGYFAGWTRYVVKAFKLKQVVLIVDETKLNARFGVMVVGVAYEGRCIPLAWRVYRANSAADYPAQGQARLIIGLLNMVRAGLPGHIKVRVLADRGIGTSPLLMRGIMTMGWTFLFRVTRLSKIVLPDGSAVCFHDQVTAPGQTYAASGQVFKKRGHIPAHVRVVWGEHAQAAWALVTNDDTLIGWEYAWRMWIEQAFRDLKSQGWHWADSALTDPDRMAHLLILLVVAYAWMLTLGVFRAAAGLSFASQRHSNGKLVRRFSLFREGLLACAAFAFPT